VRCLAMGGGAREGCVLPVCVSTCEGRSACVLAQCIAAAVEARHLACLAPPHLCPLCDYTTHCRCLSHPLMHDSAVAC
jgi:hypothetical protein